MKMEAFFQHPQWKSVLGVYTRLRNAGKQAFLVGGCVRDALLGEIPGDFDFATDASPEEVENIFPNTLAIGKAFGTILVQVESHSFEVTTFRKESGYTDGRHPTKVENTSIEEDVKRRDFTVNALYYDFSTEQVIDLVNGLKDLNERRIRFVGDAESRILEDHLRILRGLRFSAQLDFCMDESALAAIQKNKDLSFKVSNERIVAEVLKLAKAKKPILFWKALIDLEIATDLFKVELEKLKRSIKLMSTFEPALLKRESFNSWFFALLSRVDEGLNFLDDLVFSKSFRQEVRQKELILKSFGLKNYELWQLKEVAANLYIAELKLDTLSKITDFGFSPEFLLQLTDFLAKHKNYYQLPEPLLTGKDLIDLGLKPGPSFQKFLQDVYRLQLNEKILSRTSALSWLESQK